MNSEYLVMFILLIAIILIITYYGYLEKLKKNLIKKKNNNDIFDSIINDDDEINNNLNIDSLSNKPNNWADFYIINNTSNSKGFLPENWGPFAWMTLHAVALGYPDNPTIEDKLNYKMFYSNIQNILPCIKCRVNLKKHTKEINIDNYLTNSYKLHEWVTKIHNLSASTYNGRQVSEKISRNFHLNWLQDPNFIALDSSKSIFNKKIINSNNNDKTCEKKCESKCNNLQ